MKIAILAHLKHPIAQPYAGGLEMHTHLLASHLQRRGHAVTLFAAQGSDPALAPTAVCPPTGEAFDPVQDMLIDAAEADAYAAMMDAVSSGGFDLVHNNSLHGIPLRASGHLAVPMITALHTPPFPSLAAGIRDAAPRMVFTAVSRTLAQEWQPLVPDARVIGNGIDLATFAFRPASVSAPAAHAFWSGRIVPEKGLHLAIDATRRAGLPLAFAGPRPDVAYWAEAIAPRLGPDLTDLGHLDHAALARHLADARVAVITPRWEEPFGLVAVEALACGTPVAAFARGALPAILDPSCGRLARPDDVDDLAAAIRAAAQLDRQACRNRAEALFDVETMTERYEALYCDVVAQAAAGDRAPRDRLLDAADA